MFPNLGMFTIMVQPCTKVQCCARLSPATKANNHNVIPVACLRREVREEKVRTPASKYILSQPLALCPAAGPLKTNEKFTSLDQTRKEPVNDLVKREWSPVALIWPSAAVFSWSDRRSSFAKLQQETILGINPRDY